MAKNAEGAERVLRPAVFLDRDGTINVEKEYLYRIEDFEFIPGVPEAIKRLKDAGFLVVVVTNQSGVARGYYGLNDVHRLHDHIQQALVAYGTEIDAFYVCPHHPTVGGGELRVDCECRKPSAGMLLQAATDFGLDLPSSWIIGDKVTDIEAGQAAGCGLILVETGYGKASKNRISSSKVFICSNLFTAADFLCGRFGC